MKQEQFLGIARHLLGAIGAYLVAQGIADESTVATAGGAITTLLAVGWSVWEKRGR